MEMGIARRIIVAAAVLAMVSAGAFGESVSMEAGNIALDATLAGQTTFQQVTFQQVYDSAPIVVMVPSNQEDDPYSLRIRNVTTTGFEVAPVEPANFDGPHGAVNVPYLAIEPGIHQLGGLTIEAALHTTSTASSNTSTSTHDAVDFAASFSQAPAALVTIQTMVNELDAPPGEPSRPWMTPGVESVTAGQIKLSLEVAETGHMPLITQDEAIGYVAFSAGSGSFVDAGGATILCDSLTSGAIIQGWTDTTPDGTGYAVDFNQTFADAPGVTIGTIASRNGGDGGWIRRCAVTADESYWTIDEDTVKDTERSHGGSEQVGIVAFSEPFVVPEPLSLTLLAIGAAGLVMRRRR